MDAHVFYQTERPLPMALKPAGGSHSKEAKSLSSKAKIQSRRTPSKVLIVEDERLIAENLKFMLEDKGHEILGIAASGEEAFDAVETQFPDLILMDIRIRGDLDGIESASRIRALKQVCVPVIFLSAHPAEMFPHLQDLEPDSFLYLKKPYTPTELMAAIEKLSLRH